MTLAIAILSVLGAVIGFAIPFLKRRLERRERVDTAIAKRDRDVLRAGLDRLSKAKPVPSGSETKL
jgi:hypothetical protein